MQCLTDVWRKTETLGVDHTIIVRTRAQMFTNYIAAIQCPTIDWLDSSAKHKYIKKNTKIFKNLSNTKIKYKHSRQCAIEICHHPFDTVSIVM